MYLERKYLTERGKQDICLFNYCFTQYGNSVNPNPTLTHTAAAVKGKAANKDVLRRLALGPENYFPETFEQTSRR